MIINRKIKIGKIRKLIFHSFQQIPHLSCIHDHFLKFQIFIEVWEALGPHHASSSKMVTRMIDAVEAAAISKPVHRSPLHCASTAIFPTIWRAGFWEAGASRHHLGPNKSQPLDYYGNKVPRGSRVVPQWGAHYITQRGASFSDIRWWKNSEIQNRTVSD